VVVLGYAGEPYLRISAHGVEENASSLTAALNAAAATGGPPKLSAAGARQPPNWQHLSQGVTATWRDHRTRWANSQRPPIVAGDPHHSQQVFDWAMQVTVADQPVLVKGSVQWTGAPRLTRVQLALLVVGVVLLLAALFFFLRQRNQRRQSGIRRRIRFPIPHPSPNQHALPKQQWTWTSAIKAAQTFASGQPSSGARHTGQM
jgi:hypothetical protein